MNVRVLIAVGLLAAAAAGVWIALRPSTAIDPTDARQVATGQRLYQGHCASCHGARLEGQPDWQTRLPTGELPAPPHDASGHTWHHADAQLFAIVKHGVARFAPPDYKSNMPSFVGVLSDGEIRAVLAYIKSTWPREIRDRQESVSKR